MQSTSGTSDNEESSGSSSGVVESLCGRADDEILAALIAEDAVSILRGDGSTIELDLEGAEAPVDTTVRYVADPFGSRVAVVWTWSLLPDVSGSIAALFDEDGNRLWRYAEDNVGMHSPLVASDTLVIATRDTLDGFATVLLDGTDPPPSFDDFQASAPPRAEDGLIAGWRPTPDSSLAGWLDPTDGSFQPISFESPSSERFFSDGRIVYLTEDAFVIEAPDDIEQIPIDHLERSYIIANAGSWFLLSTHDDTGLARVALDAPLEELDLVPPDGVDTLACYSLRPRIDAEGALLVPTRDATAARIHRFDPTAATWTPIGEPVTAVDDIGTDVHGRSYFVQSAGFGTTFCPMQQWDPAPDALAGSILQLVRPSSGIVRVLPENGYALDADPDGACAAYGVSEGPTTIIDLESGTTHDLDTGLDVRFNRAPR